MGEPRRDTLPKGLSSPRSSPAQREREKKKKRKERGEKRRGKEKRGEKRRGEKRAGESQSVTPYLRACHAKVIPRP